MVCMLDICLHIFKWSYILYMMPHDVSRESQSKLAFCVIFLGGNRMQNHMATWLEEIGLWVCVCAFERNQIELWTSPDDPPYTLKHEEFSAGCLASCGVGAEWMQQLWFGSQNVKIRCQRFDCCCLLLWKLHGSKMIQQKSHQICECNIRGLDSKC